MWRDIGMLLVQVEERGVDNSVRRAGWIYWNPSHETCEGRGLDCRLHTNHTTPCNKDCL